MAKLGVGDLNRKKVPGNPAALVVIYKLNQDSSEPQKWKETEKICSWALNFDNPHGYQYSNADNKGENCFVNNQNIVYGDFQTKCLSQHK